MAGKELHTGEAIALCENARAGGDHRHGNAWNSALHDFLPHVVVADVSASAVLGPHEYREQLW
jgi:hypothetical protein